MQTVVIRKKSKKPWLLVFFLAIIIACYAIWALRSPVPALSPDKTDASVTVQTPPARLNWPARGQAAVGIVGTGLLETHGVQTPAPTASTAKIITCLLVLQQKPLSLNDAGPLITLTSADVDRYRAYVSRDGSVVPVVAGEKITEYQALQTIMLPSANNMADSLAIWAYGSLANYAAAANAYLSKAGLKNTYVGSDASGLAADTTSTAADMVRLGELAMKNQVLKQIVSQATATGIPLVNNIKNVNALLGSHNIIGVKTGNSDEAGGAFVGAATTEVNGKTQIVVTAILNSVNLASAMQDSVALITSTQDNFRPVKLVEAGQSVGRYSLPWGGHVYATAIHDLEPSVWQGRPATARVKLDKTKLNPDTAQTVGHLSAESTSVPIKLQTAPPTPPALWQLTHPFD